MERDWRDAEEGERRSRARFAQNTIKPEEVVTEWQRWRDLLGVRIEVHRFVERAMSRLDAPLRAQKNDGCARIFRRCRRPWPSVWRREVLKVPFELLLKSRRLRAPRWSAAVILCRRPSLKSCSKARSIRFQLGAVARPGWRVADASVKVVTTVALLRLRYKLIVHGRRERMLLAEEAAALAWDAQPETCSTAEAARALLEQAARRSRLVARQRLVTQAIERMPALDGPSRTMLASGRTRSPRITPASARLPPAAPGLP